MSARRRRERAPAKINLGLRVVGRRVDGYHEIESLFLPLDLADQVEVVADSAAAANVSVAVTAAADLPGATALGPDADNLAARAARAFLDAAGLSARVEIALDKRIPVGAGLGGGSSDAAAVLRACDHLYPEAVPSGELARLALGLGADVPFFLAPRPALVTGIGERIEPVSGLPPLSLVLANPGVSLATAEVYAGFDREDGALTRVSAGSTMRALSGLRAGDEPSSLAAFLADVVVNDLEPPARRLCPDVSMLRARLDEAGALVSAMSGSGATVFGVFSDAAAARAAEVRIAGRTNAEEGTPGRLPLWTRVAISTDSI